MDLEKKIKIAIEYFKQGWSPSVAKKYAGITQGEWYSDHPKMIELRKFAQEKAHKRKRGFY